jgi:hypothetical protein
VAAGKTYEVDLEIFDMIPPQLRANFTELIRLRAKSVDFGVYLRSNSDAGTSNWQSLLRRWAPGSGDAQLYTKAHLLKNGNLLAPRHGPGTLDVEHLVWID